MTQVLSDSRPTPASRRKPRKANGRGGRNGRASRRARPRAAAAPRFHRIHSLQIEGGFLDGCAFEFDDHLSTIIGGRGTGKTTVVELMRWVLHQPPRDPRRAEDHEKLVKSNLGSGVARLKVETADGVVYFVERTAHDHFPKALDANGDPTEFSLKAGVVFGADVLGQNEIEQIADEPRYQLMLIDKFVKEEVTAGV